MMSQQIGDLISREETLTAFSDYVGSGMSMNDFDALWDIVAKMPPANPQEPCDDAISRKQAIKTIEKFCSPECVQVCVLTELPSVNPQEPSRDMKEIAEIMKCDADAETKCRMISNILTAKPHYFEEPKTGHWERISNDITLIQHDAAYYKCSECGEKVIGKHNYCQFCGAKMVEPQESENKE